MNAEGSNLDERANAKHQERLAIEAADWVARGALTKPSEHDGFSRWLMESPEHVKEFLAASGWNDTLPSDLAEWRTDVDRLLSGSNVIHVPRRTAAVARSPLLWFRRSHVALIALSASAAIALLVSPLVRDFWSANSYATSIGEQRTVALSDGSLVAMNTNSRIRMEYSAAERTVYLTAGQAMFTVAHDAARPFRVHVEGGAVVQAVGTKFDIRRMDGSTTVAVLEGRVQITPSRQRPPYDSLSSILERTRLTAGEAVQIMDGGGLTLSARIDVSEVNAWQERRLVFRDDTLKKIVDEFQRYSRTRIRIEDRSLADRRYSGVWDADHPEDLLNYLSMIGAVSVERDGDGFLLRSTVSPPSAND